MDARSVVEIVRDLAQQERALHHTTFLAPCVAGGEIQTRIAGLVRTFKPKPRNFEGWGLFRAVNERVAELAEDASLPLVGQYLSLLEPALRLCLAHQLRGRTWLAYPANESDARQRWSEPRPLPVHLVTDGGQFEQVIARWDGSAWWFEEIDRRADPRMAESLRSALRDVTPPEELRFGGLTPEGRTAYDLAAQQTAEFFALIQQRRDEARLAEALRTAGGELRDFQDRGEYWVVDWTTRDGDRHTSAIARQDLTVMTAGICLHNERDFDLQSLVGVVGGARE